MATAVTVNESGRTCVTRQPIFDRERRVFAYELLVRPDESLTNAGGTSTGEAAKVIANSLMAIGLDTLVGERLAFVSVTRDMLVADLAAILPKDRVVVQLGIDIEADDEVIARCRELADTGYALAIDDFALTGGTAPLVALAKYLKVDFGFAETAASRQRIGVVHRPDGPLLVATNVDTPKRFQAAVAEGFAYLQGDFLGHPVVTAGKGLEARALGRLRVLHALHNPMLSVSEIEALIKPDTVVCFQVLRTVNSAAFAQHRTIHSIEEALLLLGRDMIRRWISVWTLAGLGRDVHPELITTAAVRARYCELLGEMAGGPSFGSEAFLTGMCSMLDTVLGAPMEEIVRALPLSDESKTALLGGDNRLRWLLDCVTAWERGDWNRCFVEAARIGLKPLDLSAPHVAALRWARELQRV